MRTVHYVVGWPADQFPSGIVTATDAVAGALREAGCDASILAMNGQARADERHIAFVSDARPEPFLAKFSRRVKTRLSPFAASLDNPADAIARRLVELQREKPFDVVEMEESFGWSAIVARSVPAPVVTRLHGPYFLTGAAATGGVFSALEEERIRREGAAIAASPLITAPSRFVLDAVRDHYGLALDDAVVIPNPSRAPEEKWVWRQDAADPNEILFVGRFDRIKGADMLLRAFAALATKRPALKLTFAGPSDKPINLDGRSLTRQEFLAETMAPEIAARIDFRGVVARGELGDLRARAFLTVVSSRIETFANVALEAMAHGSPLVATEVGGIPDVARKDIDALLVPCEAEALAAAIGALLDDPARAGALGASGRKRALSEYAPARIAEMTLAAYRGLLARRRSSTSMQTKAG